MTEDRSEELLERRIAFAEAHCESRLGRRFTRKERPWIVEDFWRPADGWRFAAVDPHRLCDACKDQVGKIMSGWSWPRVIEMHEHAKRGIAIPPAPSADPAVALGGAWVCRGLAIRPILITALNLPRRAGKTFNTACWTISTAVLQRRRNITFIAAARDQTQRIFEDNWEHPITHDPKLKSACIIMRTPELRVEVPSTGSAISITPTSHRSITGSGYSHVVVDECRDVHPRVVAALVFSNADQNGIECPRGHVQRNEIRADSMLGPDAPDIRCPTCGDRMVPWYPRVLLTSSSGVDEGSDFDWFNELVRYLSEQGHPNAHVLRSERSDNPNVSMEVRGALGEVLGSVRQLKHYVQTELTNRAGRVGEDFLTDQEVKAILRPHMVSIDADTRQAVAFLDTSWSSDITTLAVAIDTYHGEPGHEAWEHLTIAHITKWKPKLLPKKVIDDEAVERRIDLIFDGFPNLQMLLVDDRGMQWAKDLVVRLNRSRPWGKKVALFHGKGHRHKRDARGQRLPGVFGGTEDRSAGWQMLEYRAVARPPRIMCPDDQDLREEIKGVTRRVSDDGSYVIMDRNRKVKHADVIEAIAGCCFLAYLLETGQIGSKRMHLDEVERQAQGRGLAVVPMTRAMKLDRIS